MRESSHEQDAQLRDPSKRCARAKRDEILPPEINRVWQANMQVYGVPKVWKQMNREGIVVARCTVGRPNQLWVSDFIYVSTWQAVWFFRG